MAAVLREACDACHKRKMRCPTDGAGACVNCRRTGQVCQYSPRCEMGRPRLNSPTGKRSRGNRVEKRTSLVAGGPSINARSPDSARASSLNPSLPLPRGDSEGAFLASQDNNRTVPELPAIVSEAGPQTLFWGNTLAEPTLVSEFPMYDASWAGSTMGSSTGSPGQTPMFNPNLNGFDTDTTLADPNIHAWNSGPTLASPSSVLPEPNDTERSLNQKQCQYDGHPRLLDTAPIMLPTNPNGYYEAYLQLSSILFSLQTLSSYPSDLDAPASPITRDQNQQSRNIDKLFAQVSSLCNIMIWISTNMPISARTGMTQDLEVVSLHPTITSLAITISTIYAQRLDKYKTVLGRRHQAGALAPGLQFQILTDATTMEFHLGQLGRMLKDAPGQEICDSQTVAKLEGLRMSVKVFVDECRV